MRIALIDVDSKIPNLALMKLSAHHKAKGDNVEFFTPLFSRPDLAHVSKVFTDSPDYEYWPDCEIIKGGSGYDMKTELPPEIESLCPDYSLYGIDYAMGFTTRGCIRRCPFCIVPIKEGHIRAVADIYDFWSGQKNLMLMDNNLTAEPEHYRRVLGQLIKHGTRTSFSQGLDIRLIDDEKAALLARVKLWKGKGIHFAFDSVKYENTVRRGIAYLLKAGIAPRNLTFYVLIGFDSTPEEDLHRVELLRSLGVNPFVMPYNRRDTYQRVFARWVNHKAIFKSVKWQDYKPAIKAGLTQHHASDPRWAAKVAGCMKKIVGEGATP